MVLIEVKKRLLKIEVKKRTENYTAFHLIDCYTILWAIKFEVLFNSTLSSKDKNLLVVSGPDCYLKPKKHEIKPNS